MAKVFLLPFLGRGHDISGAIISPHKSHDGRCSSAFRAAIILILSRDRRKMSQQTPARLRPLIAQAVGSPLVWFASLKNAAERHHELVQGQAIARVRASPGYVQAHRL